ASGAPRALPSFPTRRSSDLSVLPPVKTRFIVNPFSGRAARARNLLGEHARTHGADIVDTERPRHATELARQAVDDGCGLIVAVGDRKSTRLNSSHVEISYAV